MGDVNLLSSAQLREAGPCDRAAAILLSLLADLLGAVSSLLFSRSVVIKGRRFVLRSVIAEGGCSIVYLAQPSDGGRGAQLYAIKQILSDSIEGRDEVQREVTSHRAVVHDNCMPIIDVGVDHAPGGRECASLLFPFLAGGSAQDLINSASASRVRPPFAEAAAAAVGVGVARGLAALHSSGRAHRDVCPRNVLLRAPPAPQVAPLASLHVSDVVLADFGSCAPVSVRISSRADALRLQEEAAVRSSQPYRAPELWHVDAPATVTGEATDVFALGCTVFACAFGFSPFESTRGDDGQLKLCEASHTRVLGAAPTLPAGHGFSQRFVDTVLACVEKDPSKRPTIAQVLAALEPLAGQSSRGQRTRVAVSVA